MDMGTIMKIASALLGIPPARLPIYDQASLNSILQKVLGANMGQKKSVMV